METYFIKLAGKGNIPEGLSIGHNYHIVAEGSVTEEKKSDNNDGSMNVTYKFEPVLIETVKETGESIRAKDTRSRSQQLRAALFRKWRDSNDDKEFDKFYDEFMVKVIGEVINS